MDKQSFIIFLASLLVMLNTGSSLGQSHFRSTTHEQASLNARKSSGRKTTIYPRKSNFSNIFNSIPAPIAGTTDVDFGPYMADLQRRIKKCWFPPKGNETKRVVVVFKIHRSGELSHLLIEKSSGVAVADQAALEAVKRAVPFRALPTGAPDNIDIEFTFDYNVFGGGGRVVFRQP